MAAGFDGEEEGVVLGIVVDAARVAALAGDGLVDEAGFEGEQFDDPLIKNEVRDGGGEFAGVVDGGEARLDDFPDAGPPGGREFVFFGVEMVPAGVLGGALLALGRRRTSGFQSVGAIGGESFFGHADQSHSSISRMEFTTGCQGKWRYW